MIDRESSNSLNMRERFTLLWIEKETDRQIERVRVLDCEKGRG